MNILFIHQNFPGQYRYVASALADDAANQVYAIGEAKNLSRPVHQRITQIGYETPRGAGTNTHHYLRDFEAAVRRGQQLVRVGEQLRSSGFEPDVICCHPSWGEGLYLRDVWPNAGLLYFFEFFYAAEGRDTGFDPEFPLSKDGIFKTRTRNAAQLLSLNVADWGISPTQWQYDSQPAEYRNKISVIFDGVDTDRVSPSNSANIKVSEELTLTNESEVITFVNRNLEPYRGYHVFMRSLPRLMKERPNAHIVIVGEDGVSYGTSPSPGETYQRRYLAEVEDSIDLSRVHYLGRIPYESFVEVLRISSVHVYLTYPFVLSWSMVEAMSAGCAIVASATPPVEEFIQDGENGLLFDFFDTEGLVDQVCSVLTHPDQMDQMRRAARRTAVELYDLKRVCLPKQIELIKTLANGKRPVGA